MAGVFVSLVLDAVRGCGSAAKLTLVALADRAPCSKRTPAQEIGCAWPSLADIGARTDRHERQVRQDMRELEQLGWIVAEGSRKGGRNRPTTYRLNLPQMINALSLEKAAEHCRVLQKIPGTLPPGFIPASVYGNPALQRQKPGAFGRKPGAAAHETRHCSAAEPVLTEALQPGFEPEHATAPMPTHQPQSIQQIVDPLLKKIKGEPEKRRHMTRDEQSEVADGFQEFWNAYPARKRVAKGEAEIEWVRLRPSPDLRRLIRRALARQRDSADWIADDGRFIPTPAKWLQHKRWEDAVYDPTEGAV